jgi:response regulator NasT
MNPLRIVLAEPDREARLQMEDVLGQLGHRVTTTATGRELVELARRVEADLVVAATPLPDMGGIEAAEQVNRVRETPFILVAGPHSAGAPATLGGEHVMAGLARPVGRANAEVAVALAMARFGHYRRLKGEAAALREALEDRKLIERARGEVMRWLGLGEHEAFARLKRLSSHSNVKLPEVARKVLAAEVVFRQLDEA